MSVQFIENDGGKLAVEVRGSNAAAPLIVCSPGLGDTRDAYYPVADQLVAAGYRVALVDLRGLGESSTSFTQCGDLATASDFIKVAEALRSSATEKVVLAGASLSAGAATIAAGQRPDLVAGLVLLGPFLRNGNIGAVFRVAMAVMLWRPWGPWIWKTYAATMWPGLGPDNAKARAQSTTALLTRSEGKRWAAFQALSGSINHDDVTPFLPKVKSQPALVVMGDKDPDWTDPLAEAVWVASNFETVTSLTVVGAGHAPMYEKPDIVGPEFVRFMNGLRNGGAFK
ncbi:hydrolase [Ophiostoma piceae UAMH 11346]|uniref:Hydrolase n=1 Tax=Ophiostoma piceae (strain UAMH 11346) TaxID=1262450 RepID=S3BX85_OPHP1|nr:hydrolase [Ophiostoma piceae UAMH 11346]